MVFDASITTKLSVAKGHSHLNGSHMFTVNSYDCHMMGSNNSPMAGSHYLNFGPSHIPDIDFSQSQASLPVSTTIPIAHVNIHANESYIAPSFPDDISITSGQACTFSGAAKVAGHTCVSNGLETGIVTFIKTKNIVTAGEMGTVGCGFGAYHAVEDHLAGCP